MPTWTPPVFQDYRYEEASIRFAYYTVLRERWFTIAYDGNENMVLTATDGEAIRYEFVWRETPPGQTEGPGQHPMQFNPVAGSNSELGYILVSYPRRHSLPQWEDEFMFVEHTKRLHDHFGNWANRTATYTCATPKQIEEYKPDPDLHCTRVPYPDPSFSTARMFDPPH